MGRVFGIVAMLGITGVMALPSLAAGQATIERFSFTTPIPPTAVDDTCAGAGVVGILTGTDTIDGQFVTTARNGHFKGTETLVYRVDFADGSYLVASQREPLTFSGDPSQDNVTIGGTLLEMGTLYDAQGNVIGHEMFHAHFRTTIVGGTVIVELDEGFLTCR
jgi:hypothetical protein